VSASPPSTPLAPSTPADGAAAFSAPGDSGTGYGMSSMAERAELVGGRLEVLSSPGRGTTVIAKVPAA